MAQPLPVEKPLPRRKAPPQGTPTRWLHGEKVRALASTPVSRASFGTRKPRPRRRTLPTPFPPNPPLLRPLLEQEPRHATPEHWRSKSHRRKTARSETSHCPAAAQGHRPCHAPALARPHPPRLGHRPAPVPVLQRHHEPSGGGSRETDHDEGVALKRSGRMREPEEATESMSWTPSSGLEK